MAVTSGFFNSLNGDRKYDALQISSIFDGIIVDGVFATYGDAFAVKPSVPASLDIIIGTGRAWFNHTWLLNDTPLSLTVPIPDVAFMRIDTVYLEVNTSEEVRENKIAIAKGTFDSMNRPLAPVLIDSDVDGIHQYAIALIYSNPGTSSIVASNIQYVVGRGSVDEKGTPFVTGIIDTIDSEILLAQWEAEWEEWKTDTDTDTTDLINAIRDELTRLNAGTEVMLKSDYAPNATATLSTTPYKIEIESIFSHPQTDYYVEFNANFDYPTTLPGVLEVGIDGTVVVLTTINGEPIQQGWKMGDFVCIRRMGSTARIISPSNSLSVGTGGVSFYVNSTLGSDSNDGSQAAPFQTITKALNVLPKFSLYSRVIYVSPGTYEENNSVVNISGFSGAHILIYGSQLSNVTDSVNYKVRGFSIVDNSAEINLYGFCATSNWMTNSTTNFNVKNSVAIASYCSTQAQNPNSGVSNTRGFSTDIGGGLYCINCLAQNRHWGFYSTFLGRTILSACTVANILQQGYGLRSAGGIIHIYTAIPGVTIYTSNGGLIINSSGGVIGT